MLFDVILSPVAKITYYQILEDLEQNRTIKEIEDLINRLIFWDNPQYHARLGH